MKVTVDKNLVLNAANIAAKHTMVKDSSSFSVFSSVQLTAGNNSLEIKSTNLNTSFLARIPAEVKQEGSVLVYAKSFVDCLTTLSDSTISLFSSNNKRLQIKTDKIQGVFTCRSGEEFPEIETPPEGSLSIQVETKKLSELITKAFPCVSKDNDRYALTGINFVFEDGNLKIFSADGFRLFRGSLPLEQRTENFNIVVPSKSLSDFQKIFEDKEETLTISANDKRVWFSCDSVIYSSSLISHPYPLVENVIPNQWNTTILLNRTELLSTYKLSKAFSGSETIPHITIHINNGKIKIFANETELGSAEQVISGTVEGEDIVFRLNSLYLTQIVNAIRGGEVLMKTISPRSPVMLKEPDADDYFYLLMPMEIKD